MKNTDNKPTIYFDLDGTLYDLYGMPDWLQRITALEDASAYASEDALLVDMVALHEVLYALMAQGYTIGVITWLANGIPAHAPVVAPAKDYATRVRAAKRDWISKFLPMATEVHIVRYGTPKHYLPNNKSDAIIVDDNSGVRAAWTHGEAIDATENLIESLRGLLEG
jgi:hypothetical protein